MPEIAVCGVCSAALLRAPCDDIYRAIMGDDGGAACAFAHPGRRPIYIDNRIFSNADCMRATRTIGIEAMLTILM